GGEIASFLMDVVIGGDELSRQDQAVLDEVEPPERAEAAALQRRLHAAKALLGAWSLADDGEGTHRSPFPCFPLWPGMGLAARLGQLPCRPVNASVMANCGGSEWLRRRRRGASVRWRMCDRFQGSGRG